MEENIHQMIKTRPNGSIERYKASLVARGFSQQYGLDYDKTFNPVAKIITVQIETYMQQPKGFESKVHPTYVCKLKKALYGLKQALRAWYGKIAEFLVQNEYSVAPVDSSLFVKFQGGKLATMLVYVDDLIITGDDKEGIQRTKENLLKYGMLECKPVSMPMEMNAKLCSEKSKDLEDTTMYQQLVGSLIYLILTQPYSTYAFGVGTIDFGLLYKKGETCKVIGYYDADYAGDHDIRRLTISKRQPTVSLFTTEAEYREPAMTAQEMFHARTKHVEVHYHFIQEKGSDHIWKGQDTTTKSGVKYLSVSNFKVTGHRQPPLTEVHGQPRSTNYLLHAHQQRKR
ncbi:hypothetical protein CsSME_00030234 [Camellia sinensis var. sinensis]